MKSCQKDSKFIQSSLGWIQTGSSAVVRTEVFPFISVLVVRFGSGGLHHGGVSIFQIYIWPSCLNTRLVFLLAGQFCNIHSGVQCFKRCTRISLNCYFFCHSSLHLLPPCLHPVALLFPFSFRVMTACVRVLLRWGSWLWSARPRVRSSMLPLSESTPTSTTR